MGMVESGDLVCICLWLDLAFSRSCGFDPLQNGDLVPDHAYQ